MEIKKNLTGSKLVLEVTGRLDTTTAPSLEAALESRPEGLTELVFDFTSLEYISSAGLRVLLGAQKVMAKQGKMVVCGANEAVMEVFDVTGFTDILTIV